MKLFRNIENPNALLWIFLGIWWAVNLIQAGCTELANDEAYYYMFSQDLDWGYFDHPPMVALLVWLGHFIGGELGVRFFCTISQPLYLFLLWLIIKPERPERKDITLFVLIAAAMPILQLYGFIAVPDAPLMLFTALFLWSYSRFCKQDSWGAVLLTAVSIAALAYSKYHGALVVALTVASNLKLLKNPKFYAVCLLALLLIIPHLAWQYQHDWVSFKYHMLGRNRDFEFSFVTEYILNVLAIFNPFLFPVFAVAWWKNRTADPAQRAMSAIAAGFILFFLASTYKGYAQPQWEIPATFGIIALLWQYVRNREKLRKYTVWVCGITIALVALTRIEMIFNPLGLKFEIFDNKTSYAQIAAAAGNRPVLFDAGYTQAAKYNFYTGGTGFAQPSVYSRTSQYELKDDDTKMAGTPVVIQVDSDVPGARSIRLSNGKNFNYLPCDDFIPVRKIGIEYTPELPAEVHAGDTLHLDLTLINPYPYTYEIDGTNTSVNSVWYHRGQPTQNLPVKELRGTLPANGRLSLKADIVVPDIRTTTYRVGFTFVNSPLATWFNSQTANVRIEPRR